MQGIMPEEPRFRELVFSLKYLREGYWRRRRRSAGIKEDLSRGFTLVSTECCPIVKCKKVGQWERADKLPAQTVRAFPP